MLSEGWFKIDKNIGNFDTDYFCDFEEMIFPVPGSNRITSPYGYRIHPIKKIKKFHSGIDIGDDEGSDVVAVLDGVVAYSGLLGGYGETIVILNGNNVATLYAHNSKLLANVGDKVEKGDIISKVGSTGSSTGPHLHFEIKINNVPIDPMLYL